MKQILNNNNKTSLQAHFSYKTQAGILRNYIKRDLELKFLGHWAPEICVIDRQLPNLISVHC